MNKELAEIIASYGGLICEEDEIYKTFPSLIEILFERFGRNRLYAESELYEDRPRPIAFGLLRSTEPNAFAYASPDGKFDFVGINVGVVFTLLDVFSRLLSHPEFFTQVGDPTLETAERSHIGFLVTDVFQQDTKRQLVQPICAIRNNYALNMLLFAMDFLFFHEVSHLKSGHLEWKRGKGTGGATTNEAIGERVSKGGISGITSQALEMDADCGGVITTICMAYNYRRPPKRKDLSKAHIDMLESIYGTPKSIGRITIASIYTLFRLFDSKEWDFFRKNEFTHPQSPLRQHWIMSTLIELFSKDDQFEYTVPDYVRDASSVVFEIETGIGKILNDAPDVRGIASVLNSGLAAEHLNEVKAAWAEIRDELLPFVRGGKLAG